MNHPKFNIFRSLGKKMAVLVLFGTVSVMASATLGDGRARSENPNRSLLSSKTEMPRATFTLRSGYSYRGSQVFNDNSEQKYIRLNTVVTLQKGNIIYTVPLRKNVFLDKVKIDISNRQLKRN